MLRLNSEITIGNLVFNYVTECEINTSWETITDTAMVQLPSKITNKDSEFIKNVIKVGDPVTIKLGYFPEKITRFQGYVSKVVPESPLKIMCEDEAFLLKRTSIASYSKKDLTLEQLLKDNYNGDISVADTYVGTFRITRTSLIKVLQELKSKYKIYSWFRGGVLYSGLAYLPNSGQEHEFSFQQNIINGNALQSVDETELNTVAHGVSTQRNGSNIELYTYYENDKIVTSDITPGGDLNTLETPNKTRAQLQELLERWLPNLYYTGFKGSITTFGRPAVNHGDIAIINDSKFPEKNGRYAIKSVAIKFGQSGFRQILNLDRRV